MLTVKDAASKLAISPRTLQEWIRKKKIAFVKMPKGYRIKQSRLQAIIDGWEIKPKKQVV